jgi:hypothetical protein
MNSALTTCQGNGLARQGWPERAELTKAVTDSMLRRVALFFTDKIKDLMKFSLCGRFFYYTRCGQVKQAGFFLLDSGLSLLKSGRRSSPAGAELLIYLNAEQLRVANMQMLFIMPSEKDSSKESCGKTARQGIALHSRRMR